MSKVIKELPLVFNDDSCGILKHIVKCDECGKEEYNRLYCVSSVFTRGELETLVFKAEENVHSESGYYWDLCEILGKSHKSVKELKAVHNNMLSNLEDYIYEIYYRDAYDISYAR